MVLGDKANKKNKRNMDKFLALKTKKGGQITNSRMHACTILTKMLHEAQDFVFRMNCFQSYERECETEFERRRASIYHMRMWEIGGLTCEHEREKSFVQMSIETKAKATGHVGRTKFT